MSLQAMVWALESVSKVSPAEKLLLVVIGNYTGEDWSAWPSQATLARHTGMTTRSVGINLRKLEDAGWITREPRLKSTGGRLSDIIKLRPEKSSGGEANGGAPPEARGGSPPVETSEEPTKRTDQGNREGLRPTAAEPPKSDVVKAFDAYNATAETIPGAQTAKVLNDVRRKALGCRLKDAGGLDGWMEAMTLVQTSPFLRGERAGRRGPFVISLDFLLQPKSFARLLEGFYHRTLDNGSAPPDAVHDPAAARDAQRNAEMFAGARSALERFRRSQGSGADHRA